MPVALVGADQAIAGSSGDLLLEGKVDQRIEAVALVIADFRSVAKDFAHYPERLSREGVVWIGFRPIAPGPVRLLAQLRPRGRLDVHDSVGAKTVDAEFAHPGRQPLVEVIAHAVTVAFDGAGGLLVTKKFRQANWCF